MAKYVLLAFDADSDADEFVQRVQVEREVIFGAVTKPEGTTVLQTVQAGVRGVWKKPTKFCECRGSGGKGYSRGKKYGWWVHAGCGRPTEAWANGDPWHIALGTNLLPISLEAPEYRGPMHVQHPGYEPKEIWCGRCGRFRFKAEPGSDCEECGMTLTLSPMHADKET